MSASSLAVRQVVYEQRAFWRNRATVIGTFLFPIIFLGIFGAMFRGQQIDERGIPFLTFLVPGIIAFGVMTSTYLNLAPSLTVLREQGVLKRIRGTPLKPWAFMTGRIGSSVLTTFVLVLITLAMGIGVFGVTFRAEALPGVVTALVLGTFCFSALGLASTILMPNAESAPVIANLLLFPIMFVSNVFFPIDTAPSWLASVASVFPVARFAGALQYAFHPDSTGPAVSGENLLVMGAWGIAGLLLAIKFFRWDPKKS